MEHQSKSKERRNRRKKAAEKRLQSEERVVVPPSAKPLNDATPSSASKQPSPLPTNATTKKKPRHPEPEDGWEIAGRKKKDPTIQSFPPSTRISFPRIRMSGGKFLSLKEYLLCWIARRFHLVLPSFSKIRYALRREPIITVSHPNKQLGLRTARGAHRKLKGREQRAGLLSCHSMYNRFSFARSLLPTLFKRIYPRQTDLKMPKSYLH